MAMGGGPITERDPNATTDRNPKRTMHAMVRAHRCIFAPPENPAPAKIFDLPIHCLRQPVPELGWLREFRQSERASPRKVLRTWDLRRLRAASWRRSSNACRTSRKGDARKSLTKLPS